MKVLIPIDDSKCSSAAVHSLMDRSWPEGTEFRIISVIEPIYAPYGFAGGYVVDSMIEAEKQMEEHCRQYVDKAVLQLKALFGNDRVTGRVLLGGVAEAIVDEATEWSADLIVVGSHGRKGFQKLWLGSVAEKVASHAPCSIDIVKEKVTQASKTLGAEENMTSTARR